MSQKIGNKDIQFLSSQAKLFSGTRKFKKAIEDKRIESPGLNRQLFFKEGRRVWEEYLRSIGQLSSASIKAQDKTALVDSIVTFLPQLKTISDYKIVDRQKGLCFIRTEEADFEISLTLHRKNPIDYKGTVVGDVGLLKPHVEELATKITASDFNIVGIKNNIITIQKEDGKQLSVKLTRKKERQF